MGEWECRRADQPFLKAVEEVEVRVTEGEQPWVADAAAVVVLWAAASVHGVLEHAVVLVAAAFAAVEQRAAEHPFFEEYDLPGEPTACLLLVQMVEDSTDGVLPLIVLHCYSYFNNVRFI